MNRPKTSWPTSPPASLSSKMPWRSKIRSTTANPLSIEQIQSLRWCMPRGKPMGKLHGLSCMNYRSLSQLGVHEVPVIFLGHTWWELDLLFCCNNNELFREGAIIYPTANTTIVTTTIMVPSLPLHFPSSRLLFSPLLLYQPSPLSPLVWISIFQPSSTIATSISTQCWELVDQLRAYPMLGTCRPT